MSSIMRSSSRRSESATSLDEMSGANPPSASKSHRTRSGRRFGTSMNVNTPSKSAKKNKDGGAGVSTKKSTSKKNRSAGRFLSRASSTKKRSTSQQQLVASLPAADLSYDFASLSLSQSFGSGPNLRSTSVGAASSSSDSRDDYEDAAAMRRLPSAITADYSVKMRGTMSSISSSVSRSSASSSSFVNAASIFRSKKNSDQYKYTGKTASAFPTIERSTPIFDTDRHYTINFESDDDKDVEKESVAKKTELGTGSRLEVDASGNYVIYPPQIPKKEENQSSIDNIFRMVDRVLDNADDAMSWMCLQRANPILDSDDEDAVIHHDLHLKEETNYFQPERMWSKREDAADEDDGMVLEMGNQIAEDAVAGFTIPMPR